MVEGHRIDSVALEQFVSDVQIVIANNAAFDRKVAERHWPVFACRHWACSAAGIDRKAYGFGGARLSYLLSECGLFHDAHRALDDCYAVLEILARNLPGIEKSGFEILLDRARHPQHRVSAIDAPRSRSRTSSSNAGIAGTTVPMGDPSPRMWTSIPPAPSSTTFERRFIGGKTSMSYAAQLHRSIDSQVGHSSVVAKNGCSRCRPQR
jgi:hypothetical protein